MFVRSLVRCVFSTRNLSIYLSLGGDYTLAVPRAAIARAAAEQQTEHRREQRDHLDLAEAPRDLPPRIAVAEPGGGVAKTELLLRTSAAGRSAGSANLRSQYEIARTQLHACHAYAYAHVQAHGSFLSCFAPDLCFVAVFAKCRYALLGPVGQ